MQRLGWSSAEFGGKMGKGPRKRPINSEMNKGVDPRILIQADCCVLAGVLIPLDAMSSRHV